MPVSRLLRGGFDAVAEHLHTEGTSLLYRWLSLIFLKTHLRDRRFRFHLDQRRGSDPLSKEYDWSEFHHTHAVARSFISGCTVAQEALGSFCLFQATTSSHFQHFDYHDLFLAQAAMIRVHDVGIVAVFDDGFGALSDRADFLSRIDGPLSSVQLREVLAHLAYTNFRIVNRPRFYTDLTAEPPKIIATRSTHVEVQPHESAALGGILHACVEPFLAHMINPDIDQIRRDVKAGNYTFLYDARGQFIRNSLEPLPVDLPC